MRKLALITILHLAAYLSSAQQLRLAVYQYADNPRIKNLQPVADHLSKQIGIETTVKSYPTVHLLIKAMQQNEVDVAFISTFGYLLLEADKQPHNMQPVTALVAPDAMDNYKTAFVCRRESNIKKFTDLKHYAAKTRMLFVATGSTSGNLVPRLLLNGIGLKDPEMKFKSVGYSGTHKKAIELVHADSADVAAMGSTEWDKLDSVTKKDLHLLYLSSEIPLGPVLVNRAVDQKLKQQVITELLSVHQSNAAALQALKEAWSEAKQATHFVEINTDYYTPYLKQFGNLKQTDKIIKRFVQQ
jgi:phosphate/phosphite/phosphonate ABC transporter binding protein